MMMWSVISTLSNWPARIRSRVTLCRLPRQSDPGGGAGYENQTRRREHNGGAKHMKRRFSTGILRPQRQVDYHRATYQRGVS